MTSRCQRPSKRASRSARSSSPCPTCRQPRRRSSRAPMSIACARWAPVSETLLFYAAQREHVTRLITPALKRGLWVVCDRFADSTIAYQGYGRGLPLADLRALHRFALGDVAPDLTLILDVPVAEGLARAAQPSG